MLKTNWFENKAKESVTFFMIHFSRGNFYKVGITPTCVEDVYDPEKYGEFTIAYQVFVPMYKALELEKAVIENFANYRHKYWLYNKPGKIECIRTKDTAPIFYFIEDVRNNRLMDFYIEQTPEGLLKAGLGKPRGEVKFSRKITPRMFLEIQPHIKNITNLVDTVTEVLKIIKGKK